jgi:hypothetical protein
LTETPLRFDFSALRCNVSDEDVHTIRLSTIQMLPRFARISQPCREVGEPPQADPKGFDAGFAVAFATEEAAQGGDQANRGVELP